MASLSNILKIYSTGEVQKSTASPNVWPKWGRMIHFYERYGRSYIAQRRVEENNPRLHAGASGDPEVVQRVQPSSERPVSMTPEIERWIYRLFKEATNGNASDYSCTKAYRNAFSGQKAFNNFTAWEDGYQSVIVPANIGKEPQKLQPTICCGAMLKILGPTVRIGGFDAYPFEVFNAQDPNTLKATLKDSWWKIFSATNSTIEPAPWGNVDPFPFDGTFDVPIPSMNNNSTVAYIHKEWVEFVGDIQYPTYPYFRSYYTEQKWKQDRNIP